tara:strand:- start:570 stop:761 length:192 start_codon:yes stop_codon:yes gene_type:complete
MTAGKRILYLVPEGDVPAPPYSMLSKTLAMCCPIREIPKIGGGARFKALSLPEGTEKRWGVSQ